MKEIRNKIISFEQDSLKAQAKKLFFEMCAPAGSKEMPAVIKSKIQSTCENAKNAPAPKLIYSYFAKGSITLKEDTLSIENVHLNCRSFSNLDSGQIKGVYVYFLTAGEIYNDDGDLKTQYFADLWGTALAEATRRQSETLFKKESFLSEEFGPGFYGMEPTEAARLARLADASLIGIDIKPGGMLVPVKSCALLRFAVTENYQPLNMACKDCIGSAKSCSLCRFGRR